MARLINRIRVEHPPQRPPRTSALRLLEQSNQQISEAKPLEVNDSDVVWSSTNDNSDNGKYVAIESTSPSSVSISSTPSESPTFHNPDSQFRQHTFAFICSGGGRPPAAGSAEGVGEDDSAVESEQRRIDWLCAWRFNMSAPVNVPVWHNLRNRSMRRYEEEEVDGEILPPHEVVDSRSQTMPFSVFEGVGRTLKGRDLRNAVFQQTRFLD